MSFLFRLKSGLAKTSGKDLAATCAFITFSHKTIILISKKIYLPAA